MDQITTYFLAKEAGWKRIAKKEAIKTAFTVRDLLSGAKKAVPYVALGLGAGGIGYNVLKDRQIEGMERNRELVGAMNDTVVRQRVGDIYRMAGFPEPPMPLAVSKEISPEYKRVIAEMSSKGAMEKGAIDFGVFKQIPEAVKSFITSRSPVGHLMNAGRQIGQFTATHPRLTNIGTSVGVGLGTSYIANKIQNKKNRELVSNIGGSIGGTQWV